MKSIIQESSGVEKAVKQAWEKAGKPSEFSIRVLEIEEKNFLGFTKKPAKIAIFFEEKQQVTTPKKKRGARQKTQEQKQQETVKPKKDTAKKIPQTKIPQEKELWSKELVETATNWTRGMLNQLKLQNIKFATIAKQKNLSFNFYAPVIKDKRKQAMLFKNLSFLLMQTLRYKFKKSFRNLNVIFTSK